MTAPNRLVTLGRWIVVATQAWIAVMLVFCALLAAYSFATGKPRLNVAEPWDSIVVVAIFAPWIVVVLCWCGLCLVLTVLLRRRCNAGSFRQVVAIFRLLVPIAGVRWFDRLARELNTSGESEVAESERSN